MNYEEFKKYEKMNGNAIDKLKISKKTFERMSRSQKTNALIEWRDRMCEIATKKYSDVNCEKAKAERKHYIEIATWTIALYV